MSFTSLRRELERLHTTTTSNAQTLGKRLFAYQDAIREGLSSYATAKKVGIPQDQVLAEVSGFAAYSSTRPSVERPRGWGDTASAAASLLSASKEDIAKFVRLRERRSWTGRETPTLEDVEWMAAEVEAFGVKRLSSSIRELVLSQERRPASVFVRILTDLADTRREVASAARHLRSPNLRTRLTWAKRVDWLLPLPQPASRAVADLGRCQSVARMLTAATAGGDAAFFQWLVQNNYIYLWCKHRRYV